MFAWQLSKRTFAIHCFRLSGINFYHPFTFRFPSLIAYLKWFALNFCLVCKRNCCWELYFRFRFISFLEHKPRNLTKFSERAVQQMAINLLVWRQKCCYRSRHFYRKDHACNFMFFNANQTVKTRLFDQYIEVAAKCSFYNPKFPSNLTIAEDIFMM